MSSSIFDHPITSWTPRAVGRRNRYLTDDAYAESQLSHSNACKRKRRVKTLRHDAKERLQGLSGARSSGKIATVKRHLSKGRDAADIAVREGWMVSDVLKLIEEAKKP